MRKTWIMGAASMAALAAFGAASPAFAQANTESATSDAPGDATTRSRIAVGGTAMGKLDPAGDTDWFSIRLRAHHGYAISLAGEGAEGAKLADPKLRLLNSAGEEVASNDDGPDGLDSLLVYAADRSGTYYIEARGFGDDATGTYRLSVENREVPPDEASADVHTRGRLAVGQTVSGVLAPAGDKDWRRIDLTAGQAYRFSLASDDKAEKPLGDPFLRILNAAGVEQASDDDGGANLNSYLEFTPSVTGHYYIEAAAFGEGGEGAYVLSAAAGDIPADTTTDASVSADGDYREGTLTPGDKDWYRVELAENQTIRISLTSGGSNPLGDPYLAVHGSDGAELVNDDDGGEGLNSRIEFTAEKAGTYFIEARGFGDDAEGGYVLQVTAGEIGGDAQSADSIEPGGEGRASQINPGGDQDWYSITLVEGRPYRFNLTSDGPTPLADPLLTLYNSDGQSIATDDDGGTGFNAYLSYTPTQGGVYYLGASSFDATGTGGYLLRVSDTDVPGNADTDETLDAANGDDRESNIDTPGDLDFYAVDLEAGQRYVITVSGVGTSPLTDPFLAVKSADGAQVASDDDSGPGNDSRLVFTPTAAGRYFLQANGLGGSIGRYKIAIAKQAPARH
jgi:Bacterial pre-peptidase C-terminal domain